MKKLLNMLAVLILISASSTALAATPLATYATREDFSATFRNDYWVTKQDIELAPPDNLFEVYKLEPPKTLASTSGIQPKLTGLMSWTSGKAGELYEMRGKNSSGNYPFVPLKIWNTYTVDKGNKTNLNSDVIYVQANLSWWKDTGKPEINSFAERTTRTKMYAEFTDAAPTANDDRLTSNVTKLAAEIRPDGSIYFMGSDTGLSVYISDDGKNASVYVGVAFDLRDKNNMVAHLYLDNTATKTGISYICSTKINDDSLKTKNVFARTYFDVYDTTNIYWDTYAPVDGYKPGDPIPVHTGIQFKLNQYSLTNGIPCDDNIDYFNINYKLSQNGTEMTDTFTDGTISSELFIKNYTSEKSIPAVMYIAQYNEDCSSLISCDLISGTALAVTGANEAPASFNSSKDITLNENTQRIKVFIFDPDLAPYCNSKEYIRG